MLVKICGLTEAAEAGYLNENGADFAGMVLFFPKSRRNITIEKSREIRQALSPEIRTVAVMVSPDAEQVRKAEAAGFDYLQIHGELFPEVLKESTVPVLKAFNVSDLQQWEKYCKNPRIAGYVLDAAEPGSGKVFDWNMARQIPRDGKLLFLAGGLHAGNVAEAIRAVQPDGVDVSTGVEYPENGG